MAFFNLENFAANIAFSGVAKANKFEAEILFPSAVEGRSPRSSLTSSLKVKSITMPGKNISTTTNDTIYGPTHELAVGLTYADEISVTFFLSKDLGEKRRFDTWQDWIYSQRTYNMNFYEDYVSTINIYQLNDELERTSGVQLREVFPKSVNPLEYTNEGASQILDLTVSFAFKEWIEIDGGGTVSSNPPAIPETAPVITYPQNKKERLDINGRIKKATDEGDLQAALQAVGDGTSNFFGTT